MAEYRDHYVGVDWADKRWVVVADTGDDISIGTQPSIHAVWAEHRGATQILVDIPIGLPSTSEEYPRPCDEAARDYVSGNRQRSVFDVPARQAVQESEYAKAVEANEITIGKDAIGPQTWGIAERIHEVDVFMREARPGEQVRESHPEVCFEALSDGEVDDAKTDSEDFAARLDILRTHAEEYAAAFERKRDAIEAQAAWKRRLGIGMQDDMLDAMVLALTARLGSSHRFERFGGERDTADLPMEIVHYSPS